MIQDREKTAGLGDDFPEVPDDEDGKDGAKGQNAPVVEPKRDTLPLEGE